MVEKNLLKLINLKDLDNQYKDYKISKGHNKGYRKISEPLPVLKELQNQVLKDLKMNIDMYDYVYGFVENKTIIKNARSHLGNKYLLKMDLKSFFDTVTEEMIYEALIRYFDKERSKLYSNLCTRNGSAPQGAPSSPYLTNVVFKPIDRRLKRLAIKNDCIYTRFADDLTFSTNREDGEEFLNDLISKVQSIIDKNGFRINGGKTRLKKPNQRQTVTGITINHLPTTNKSLGVNRKVVKKFRAKLHNIECEIENGTIKTINDFELAYGKIENTLGYANFLNDVNSKYNKYLKQTKKIKKAIYG